MILGTDRKKSRELAFETAIVQSLTTGVFGHLCLLYFGADYLRCFLAVFCFI